MNVNGLQYKHVFEVFKNKKKIQNWSDRDHFIVHKILKQLKENNKHSNNKV